ncbi:metal ABC transporter substrate-binding protein [Salinithrix halophila]|uniref:Metal ABC transporter substrate-binding protein n=1 Tax=Salinithrix halophila TaxID=1485204 RepID=A0ABV8JBP3_9BACL
MKSWKTCWIGFFIFTLALTGCSSPGGEPAKENGKLTVYTSFYPLADFAGKIGGKHVKVKNLVPAGAEPHDYEPTARDLTALSDADLFIYNGAGLEPWLDKVKPMLEDGDVTVLNASAKLDLLSVDKGKHGHEDGHDHGDKDPHVWLNPIKAKQQAEAIKDAFVKKDPKHKNDYEANYASLADQFDQLDQKFAEIVKKGDKKTFITSHSAFGYLANRYELTQVAVSGISPSDEPSARKLREVVQLARKHKVDYVYFETLVSGKVAETVRKEVGARPLTLNPLEGLTKAQEAKGEDYFSIMEQNANNLAKGLGSNQAGK